MFRKLAKYIIIIINIAFLAALIASGLACFVNPARHTLIALFCLGFPIFFIINIIFVVFWLLCRKKFFLIPLAPVLIFALRFIDFSAENKNISPNAESFRVMTYNAHGIGYPYWPKHNEKFSEIADFIHSQNLDIVCIQEFSNGDRDFPTVKRLTHEFKFSHTHFFKTNWTRGDVKGGIATFSKYPIVHHESVKSTTDGDNIILITDVLIKTDTIRLINCHLQSNKFSIGEYKFIEDMNSFDTKVYKNTKIESNLKSLLEVAERMRKAYNWRVGQAETLVQLIDNSPYTTIVCGDFNDTPSSYIYRKVCRHMHDSHRVAGSGWQNTYRRFWPGIRIDYILYNGNITCTNSKVPAYDASDHRPVVGEYILKR